jgi:acetyl esterase/lipase
MPNNPKRVAVGGESAGGNMATVVSMIVRAKWTQMSVHQQLVNPVTQLAKYDMPSQLQFADAKRLSPPLLKWFYEKYLKMPRMPTIRMPRRCWQRT